MKKTPLLFLLLLNASLLVGCSPSRVSYKEATKEEFDTYFTSEKVSAAQQAFESIKSFCFVCDQHTDEMDYHLERYFDTNYYYCEYAYTAGEEKEEACALYLIDSNVENSKRYEIEDGKQDLATGETAANAFNEEVTYQRRIISRSMDDYLYLAGEYLEDSVVDKYYIGSNNTIKVAVKDNKSESKGYATFDKESLLIYSVRIDVKNEYGTGFVEYSFSYQQVEHKTPKDIGFNV